MAKCCVEAEHTLEYRIDVARDIKLATMIDDYETRSDDSASFNGGLQPAFG